MKSFKQYNKSIGHILSKPITKKLGNITTSVSDNYLTESIRDKMTPKSKDDILNLYLDIIDNESYQLLKEFESKSVIFSNIRLLSKDLGSYSNLYITNYDQSEFWRLSTMLNAFTENREHNDIKVADNTTVSGKWEIYSDIKIMGFRMGKMILCWIFNKPYIKKLITERLSTNESIRDMMTPRSEDDILKSLENRNIQDHRKEILKETRRLYKVTDGKYSMSRAFCKSIGNYIKSYVIEHGELTTDQMDDLYDMFLRGYNIVSYDGNKNGFEKMLITMKNSNWKLIIKDEYTDNDDNRIEYIFVKEPDKIASGKMIGKSKKDDLYDMFNHLTQDELFDKLAQSVKGNDMTLARLVLPYIDLEDDDRELKLCRLCVDLGHIQILEMILKKGLGMYVVKSLMYYVKNVKRSSRKIVDMVEKYKNLPTSMI